jgi:predicted nucleotidyltransferase
MTREDVFEKIRPLAPELKRLGLGKLYLFGSVARDEAETNDVDLLYETSPGEMGFFELMDATERLETLLGTRVDLVRRDLLHPRIRPRVEADLVEIY